MQAKLEDMPEKERHKVAVAMEKTAQTKIQADADAYLAYNSLLKTDMASNSWLAKNIRHINTASVIITIQTLSVAIFILSLWYPQSLPSLTTAIAAISPLIMIQLTISGVVQYRRSDEKAGSVGGISKAISNWRK